MTEVIEFPAARVKADHLPQPGDRYQAYAPYHEFKPPRIAFVSPDWSIRFFRYDHLGHLGFRILNGQADRDSDGMISMAFAGACLLYDIDITGFNIFGLFFDIGHHTVNWVWELPKERAAAKPGEPVVHAIDIREQASA